MLREEVLRSAWYEAFKADMRSSAVVRAVESSLQRVSTATSAATAWTSSRLALSLQYASATLPLESRSGHGQPGCN